MYMRFIILIMTVLLSIFLPSLYSIKAENNYTYYFLSPSQVPWCKFREVDIIGIYNGTIVKVYDITNKRIVKTFTVDHMERVSIATDADTAYKVTSNKPIYAVFWDSWGVVGYYSSFYTSVEGKFIGKEFIFLGHAGYRNRVIIIALEEAVVTIYNKTIKGLLLSKKLELRAGEWTIVVLTPGKVYKIVSTGRIMITFAAGNGFSYVPSLSGGFIGRRFFAPVRGRPSMLIIIAQENAEVSIYDGSRGELWAKRKLRKGERWIYPVGVLFALTYITSTGEIMVISGSTQGGSTPDYLGDDISIIIIKAKREVSLYAPTDLVIFAPNPCTVKVQDLTRGKSLKFKMNTDEYVRLPGGNYTISSSSDIVVQIMGEDQAYDDYGSVLPSLETAIEEIKKLPSITPRRLQPRKGIFKTSWIILIFVVIIAAGVAFYFTKIRVKVRIRG